LKKFVILVVARSISAFAIMGIVSEKSKIEINKSTVS
jgi:hypothetical protein